MITLSAFAKDHALRLSSDQAWLYLLTITFASPAKNFYLVNNIEEIISNGQKFEPYQIDISLAVNDNDHTAAVGIVIDNVERLLIENIRTNSKPPAVDIKLIVASKPNTIQAHYAGLYLKEVGWNLTTLSGALYADDILSMRYPADLISYDTGYSALFRR